MGVIKKVGFAGKTAVSLLAIWFTVMAGQAMAESMTAPNCTSCHQSNGEMIWGTIVPGSQTDTTVKVSTGKKVWNVHYDENSSLHKFSNARELRDEKAVFIKFRKEGNKSVYAEEMGYKPNYPMHTPDNLISMIEVGNLLQQSPEEGNYMVVDTRGIDNYIEGHLPRATNIPYYRLLEFKDRLPEDKNTRIIAYCRGFT